MKTLTIWTVRIELNSRPYHYSSREEAILALRVHAADPSHDNLRELWVLTPVPLDLLITDADARPAAEPQFFYVAAGRAIRVRQVYQNAADTVANGTPVAPFVLLPRWVPVEPNSG